MNTNSNLLSDKSKIYKHNRFNLIYIIVLFVVAGLATLSFIVQIINISSQKNNLAYGIYQRIIEANDSSSCTCFCIKPCCSCEENQNEPTVKEKSKKGIETSINTKESETSLTMKITGDSAKSTVKSPRTILQGETSFIFLITLFYLTVIAFIIAFILKLKYDVQNKKEKMDYSLKQAQENNKKDEFINNLELDKYRFEKQFEIDKQKADTVNLRDIVVKDNEKEENFIEQEHKRIKNKHDERLWELEEELKKKENELKIEDNSIEEERKRIKNKHDERLWVLEEELKKKENELKIEDNSIEEERKRIKNKHDEKLWELEEGLKAKENEPKMKQAEYDVSKLGKRIANSKEFIDTEIAIARDIAKLINDNEVMHDEETKELIKKLLDQVIEKNK